MDPKSCITQPLKNSIGKAERVTLLVSSGDQERDALCLAFARNSSIPIPRLGTKLTGQLWRQIVIKKDAVLTHS